MDVHKMCVVVALFHTDGTDHPNYYMELETMELVLIYGLQAVYWLSYYLE